MLRYQTAFQLIARMKAQGVSWISGKQLDGNHWGTMTLQLLGITGVGLFFFWNQALGIPSGNLT